MPKYTEYQVKQAIDQAIATGNVKAAAKDWQIPRTTLRDRLRGIEPKPRAHSHRQRLSPVQEEHLATWLLTQRALGVSPTHDQLREFAQRVVNNQGDFQPIGKNRISGFLRRNPSIKTVRGKPINFDHVEGASTERIKECFVKLAIQEIKNIPPQYRYNMDETGIMEGKGDNGLVLGRAEDNFAPIKVFAGTLSSSSSTARFNTLFGAKEGISQGGWFIARRFNGSPKSQITHP